MSFRVRSLAAISCALLLWIGADSAQAVIIDSFTTAPLLSTKQNTTTIDTDPNTIPSVTSESGLADVYGDRRDAFLELTAAAVLGADQASIQAFPALAGGIVDYSSSVGGDGAFALTYLGNFFAPGTDPDLDLLNEILEVEIAAYDAPTNQQLTMSVTAIRDGLTVATATESIGSAGTFQVSWDTIIDSSLQVDSLAFIFDLPTGGDIRLNEIRTVAVPEPTALGALAIGGVVMLRRRR